MVRGSLDPDVVVSVDTPGFGARIEYEDDVYTLVGGEITAGAFEGERADSGVPGIVVESRVRELDAPDGFEGETVAVKLDYGAKDVTFPALGREGSESNPAAFRAVRGEPPAGKFTEYDAAVKVLKRADNI